MNYLKRIVPTPFHILVYMQDVILVMRKKKLAKLVEIIKS